MIPLWIFGNGGHAKVAIDVLKAGKHFALAGIISDDPTAEPVEPGVPHIGPLSIATIRQHNVHRAFIAIGSNSTRARISGLLDDSVAWISLVHPTATVAPTAILDKGVLLSAGCIVQPFVSVGAHAIINTGATVDHDSTVGTCAHIAPGVHLAGNVQVGEGAFLGVGAVVIPGIAIGRDAIVGAGSVVIHDVPNGDRVAGNPARSLQ
jgi:sugar O-acyltransferase (sialic acid O-acetyltransferase NeuD family)